MIDTQLKNKVAIVTGANHGIGAAIAKGLAAQGVKVLISYWRNIPKDDIPEESDYLKVRAQDASQILEEIRNSGGIAEALEADLMQPETIAILFDAAEKAFGKVDILVNNAAYWEASTLLPDEAELANQFSVSWMDNQLPSFRPDIHDRAFAVNARAVAQMMSEFAKRHIQGGANWGRIINISTDGAANFPSEVTYGASKHAMESYSRSAASEFGQFGITVNIVSPGPIQTAWMNAEMEAINAQHAPLKRVGYPDDVADVVVFLASHQARWLTGQLISASGGMRM